MELEKKAPLGLSQHMNNIYNRKTQLQVLDNYISVLGRVGRV